jgi:hypothetical protein
MDRNWKWKKLHFEEQTYLIYLFEPEKISLGGVGRGRQNG